jgi:carboxymethylenebutenolidase
MKAKHHRNYNYGKNNKTKKNQNKKRYSLGAVFDKHIKCEFQDHDVDATMKTMVREPYVHHVPMLTGGIGYDEVYKFYKNYFVGKMPDDTKVERISRTVGKEQVVDELILKFTHEHIYWDQGSLLAQIGLLDTNNLPITGVEQSKKLQQLAAK